ncbi:MAG: hypothetical protein JNK07_16435 [Alphaproteobacteria bacterium]|nr:hypothetical protein [Alphaproteobacteria bacterium]
MSAATVIALLSEVIVNLPAAITTGQQVIRLVNDGYRDLQAAIGDRDVTAAEIEELVKRIVANSAAIQSIG